MPYDIEQEKRKTVQEVAEAMQALVKATNRAGRDKEVAEGLLKGLITSHPTLQQSFMRALVQALPEYAKRPGDLRNEAARNWAGQAAELEACFPFY